MEILAMAIQRGCCTALCHPPGTNCHRRDRHTSEYGHNTPPIFPISPFGTYMQLASEAGEDRYKSWRQRGKMAHTLPRYTYTRYAGCTGSIHRIYCKICREASTSSIPFAEDFRLRLKAFFSMHFCLKGRRAFESPAPDLQRSQRVSCSWRLSQETPRSPS